MFLMVFIPLTVLFLFADSTARIPQPQYYHVVGKLYCGDSPANDVLVKLVDDDFGKGNKDDVMDSARTDSNGCFNLSGSATESTTIDPQLKIYHDCADRAEPCQRRWKFELPNEYITAKGQSPKVVDIGVWNLEALLPGESRDCIH